MPSRLRSSAAAGRAAEPHAPLLDRREGEDRHGEQVPQLLREDAEASACRQQALIHLDRFAPPRVFGDRRRDRVVEPDIENPELQHGDRRVFLLRELGDRLAQVPVVMDDLVDGEAIAEQLGPVDPGELCDLHLGRGTVHAGRRRAALRAVAAALEHTRQLVEEDGDSVLQLRGCRARRAARRDLHPASIDQLQPVGPQEFVQHFLPPTPAKKCEQYEGNASREGSLYALEQTPRSLSLRLHIARHILSAATLP
jgi:hypothetical protein